MASLDEGEAKAAALRGPDAGKGGESPDPLYAWDPKAEPPVLSGTPSSEQWWTVSFARTARHLEVDGNDNTMGSKVGRMVRRRPLLRNEAGSEGWSVAGVAPGGWFEAYGPRDRLSLRSSAKSAKEPRGIASLMVSQGFVRGCDAPEGTWAPLTAPRADGERASRPSCAQTTQIDGGREREWIGIRTTDNTFVTRIRRASRAKGSPWWVRRDEADGMLEAWCPKGCLSFRS